MSRLPHLVWDMGGIMYRYFTEVMVEEGRDRGWPLDEIPLGPTGSVPDPDYERMCAGEIDEPEYVAIVLDRLSSHGIEFDPYSDLDWEGGMRRGTMKLIDDVAAAGHRQAVLTNGATRWLGADWSHDWEPGALFDVMVDVVALGVSKPAPEPYLAVAAALGVPPQDCLFIDDIPANLGGAEAVGMGTHHFSVLDPAGSLASLRIRLDLDGRDLSGHDPSP